MMTLNLSADMAPAPPSRWLRRTVWAGLVWAACLIGLMGMQEGASPEDRTLAMSIALSGIYTLLLRQTRNRWLPRLADRPLRNAMILGSVNAAVIETLFLVVEKWMGASGVAAHPNLILDLLLTMPWYIGMVIIFVRAQYHRRFSSPAVLLLGGLYEVGADGFVGGGFGGAILSPAFFLMVPLLYFWLFIPVYSSMVLPPAWVIERVPPPLPGRGELQTPVSAHRLKRWYDAYLRRLAPRPSGPAWKDAFRPLLWLIPFAIYLLAFLVIAGVISALLGHV